MAKFTPIETTTRSQNVFDHIKDAIFKGKLQPGEPLKELQLAREFQLSQATIREALIQLEKIGLVVRIPHKGTSIIKLTEKEITEHLMVRFHLEELSLLLAAQNMTEDDYEELNNLASEITEAVDEKSFFSLIKADLRFHRFIWKKSDNQVLYNMLDQITVPLFAYLSLEHHKMDDDISRTVMSHEKFISVLKSKSVNKIQKLIRELEKHSYQRYFPNGKNLIVPKKHD